MRTTSPTRWAAKDAAIEKGCCDHGFYPGRYASAPGDIHKGRRAVFLNTAGSHMNHRRAWAAWDVAVSKAQAKELNRLRGSSS